MKLTKEEFKNLIRQKSLSLLKETQAFSHNTDSNLGEKIEDIEEGFIDRYERKLDSLDKEEKKAEEKEEYAEIQRINEEKLAILSKLIAAHAKKVEYLNAKRTELKQKLEDLGVQGHGVFKNKSINEFNNELFKKGNIVSIKTKSADLKVQKLNDALSQYKVLDSNAPGILAGDVVVLPNMKVGGQAQIRVYRKMDNERFEELSQPTLSMIMNITKNPS